MLLLYFVLLLFSPLTQGQVLVRSSVLLRLLQQQAAGLLQAEPGDERYCRECLAGETSVDCLPTANDKQPAKNNRSSERDWEHSAFLHRLLHTQDAFVNHSKAHLDCKQTYRRWHEKQIAFSLTRYEMVVFDHKYRFC